MNESYPPKEFLRDFHDWQLAHHKEPDIFIRAEILFTRRYHPDLETYVFRVNRFKCILRVIHTKLPELIQDRIAIKREGGMRYIPEELLLALHDWYCRLDERKFAAMPDPNWEEVLDAFDKLWGEKC